MSKMIIDRTKSASSVVAAFEQHTKSVPTKLDAVFAQHLKKGEAASVIVPPIAH